jgi:hypothetical protein
MKEKFAKFSKKKKKEKKLEPQIFFSYFNFITFWNDETLENSINKKTLGKTKKKGTKKDDPSGSQVFGTCLDRF